MTVERAVVIVLPIIAGLVVVAFSIVIGRAVRLRLRSKRERPLIAPARQALIDMMTRGGADAVSLATIRRLRTARQVRLLSGLALNLGGGDRKTLCAIATELGLVARARAMCSSRLWWRRLDGARFLTLCDEDASMTRRLLADPAPLVRAQAAEMIGNREDSDLAALLPLLTDEADVCRFAAKDALMRAPTRTEPIIRGALASATDAMTEPLLEIATAIGSHAFSDAGLARSRSGVAPVRVRAVALLRAIGSPDTVARLIELTTDADDGVRAAAIDALASMAHWPAAPAFARRLSDSAAAVRRRAGLGLRRLGAPGELMLRRASEGSDPTAAEAARVALGTMTGVRG